MVERAYQIFRENISQPQGLLPWEFLKHFLFFDIPKVSLVYTQLTSPSKPAMVRVRLFLLRFFMSYTSPFPDPSYCIVDPDLDRTFVVRIYFSEKNNFFLTHITQIYYIHTKDLICKYQLDNGKSHTLRNVAGNISFVTCTRELGVGYSENLLQHSQNQ